MSAIDELLRNNEEYAREFDRPGLPTLPSRRLAVVACMDARLDVYRILGLVPGEAHVIRNAGGVVTEDVLRSLLLSQRLLGTREIALVQHTGCGLLMLREDEVKAEIEAETGRRPAFAFEAFDDLAASVRRSIGRLRSDPFLPHTGRVRGFIYDVETGRLEEVTA
ncbi:MAG TPA: carbonic anhydrase [Gemmatimonadota bacterium]|nr:carbonic anhydrase [Gemmatimonadota bacterium]